MMDCLKTIRKRPRPLQNSPYTQQPKPKHRISAVFRSKYPLRSPQIPDNRVSELPFRWQQAHVACWLLSAGSNTSLSDGFAHSLCSDQNKLPGHGGIYGAAYQSFVRPHNGFLINVGYVWFALPSAAGCGGICT